MCVQVHAWCLYTPMFVYLPCLPTAVDQHHPTHTGGQDGTELDIEVLRVALLLETWEGEGPDGWTNTAIFQQQSTQQPLVTKYGGSGECGEWRVWVVGSVGSGECGEWGVWGG